MSSFDISPCFDDAEQAHHFMMTFDQPYHPYLDDMEFMFKYKALLVLAQLTHASPVRFQNLQVDYNEDTVYLTATLLGQPDFINYFQQTSNPAHPFNTQYSSQGVTDADSCAANCLLSENIICNSFVYCPTQQQCMLSTMHVPDGASDTQSKAQCTHYSRVVNGTIPAPSMLHAYQTLKDIVYLGGFAVQLSLDNQKTITYTATSIRDDIIRPNPPKETEGEYLNQFKLYKTGGTLAKNDFWLTQLALDDCATACIEEDTFDCQSFDYIFTTGDCHLSHQHPDRNPNLITANSYGRVYAREYLDEYQKYPGQVLLTKADKVLDKTTTADMCAQACSSYSAFTCKSFDYCPKLQSCRLHKTHILEAPDVNVGSDPSCDHYSRNYIYNFNKKGGKIIDGDDDTVISGVSKDACAKLCEEQKGYHCLSFEFCGNISECRLSQAHPRKSAVPLKQSIYCDLYTQKAVSQLPGNPQAQNQGQGYIEAGPMVGVAFGVLIPGVVLGAFLMYLVRSRRAKRDDEMQLRETDS